MFHERTMGWRGRSVEAACSAAIALTLLAHGDGSARADTIHIPDDYPTIQDGIDAAVDGDEVVIADGTWTGEGNRNLDFGGRLITVRSESGDPARTIIDCASDGRGFYFHSGEGPTAIVDGLTITNGSAAADTPEGNVGGGIYCRDSDPTIVRSVITESEAGLILYEPAGHGGGIYCRNSSMTIRECTISLNTVASPGPSPTHVGGNGGGIYALSSTLLIERCTIEGNRSGHGAVGSQIQSGTNAGHGGGIFCMSSTATIVDCLITGNEGGDGGGSGSTAGAGGRGGNGGGIHGVASTVTITRSTITANHAGDGGAGVHGGGHGGEGGGLALPQGTIIDCVIEHNTAGDGGFADTGGGNGGRGGGLLALGTVSATRCIIRCNSSGDGGYAFGSAGDGGQGGGVNAGSGTFVSCLISDNTSGRGSGGFENPGDGGDGAGVWALVSRFVNCTITRNTTGEGGSSPGGDGERGVGGGIINGTVTGCILWANDPDQASTSEVTYSAVEGGHEGAGNIADDPLFVDPDTGDHHLTSRSPCIDAGDNEAVPKGMTEDLDGGPRFVDDPNTKDTGRGDPPIVDMGAYESQIACPEDLDGSGAVDFGDIVAILTAWGRIGGPEDLDGSGTVGFGDVLIVLSRWGPCP